MLGFRDPRQVIQGKIDAKIQGAKIDAEVKARQGILKAGRGAVDAAKGKVDPKKKKKMGWWPFGGKKEAAEVPTCTSCSKEVDPSWQVCPFCRSALGAAAGSGAPAPGNGSGAPAPAPGGPPMIAGDKTMAIDINALGAARKGVVGWLVVMNGNQKGIDYRLFEGRNTIGAGADNDIVVTDEYLSTKHCTIRFEESRYEVIDNDSTNGTFVNEKRVSKEELIDNDTVRLGRTELRFKALY